MLGLIAEGRSTRISNRSQPVQFDGDTVDPTNRLAVEIDPSSLTLAVPDHQEGRRSQSGGLEQSIGTAVPKSYRLEGDEALATLRSTRL